MTVTSPKIWKFQLEMADLQRIQMPEQSKILKAGYQGGNLFLWSVVRPSNKIVDREIRILGTGHSMMFEWYRGHIDTVFQGQFVWHVFDMGEFRIGK